MSVNDSQSKYLRLAFYVWNIIEIVTIKIKYNDLRKSIVGNPSTGKNDLLRSNINN